MKTQNPGPSGYTPLYLACQQGHMYEKFNILVIWLWHWFVTKAKWFRIKLHPKSAPTIQIHPTPISEKPWVTLFFSYGLINVVCMPMSMLILTICCHIGSFDYWVCVFVQGLCLCLTWKKPVWRLERMLATQSYTISMWILVLSFLRMIRPAQVFTTKVKTATDMLEKR